MIEKLTPEQLKAAFDLSDTSDVTKAERIAAREKMGYSVGPHAIRLLKHYHPEIFVDPRLEAAKKLAREILAEEFLKVAWRDSVSAAKAGEHDKTPYGLAIARALLMDPPTGEADGA